MLPETLSQKPVSVNMEKWHDIILLSAVLSHEGHMWVAVCRYGFVTLLFFVLTENALRSLLEALTSPPYAPMQHLEREQALAKQFAEILHFTLSFDELKVIALF